jgi:hypothetical protein
MTFGNETITMAAAAARWAAAVARRDRNPQVTGA